MHEANFNFDRHDLVLEIFDVIDSWVDDGLSILVFFDFSLTLNYQISLDTELMKLVETTAVKQIFSHDEEL